MRLLSKSFNNYHKLVQFRLCNQRRPLITSTNPSSNPKQYQIITRQGENGEQKEKDKEKSNVYSDRLTYLLVLFTTTGYLVYRKLHSDTIVSALGSGGGDLRKRFNFVADVVDKCSPSVVYIEIKDMRRLDFFTGRPSTISNGSGFIVKEDGLILTNAHVVTDKPHSKVVVRLQNGDTYTGVVQDLDMKSDLATVRISSKAKLPAMKLGSSADLRSGEFVIAMGSPLALSNTVTFGVISSTHRGSDELGLKGKDMVYLQTDAAITFGNSGGPLVNLDGEAIGINSMKVTAGISFAIPSDYVKQFLASAEGARKTGATLPPPAKKYMGITMLTITPQILHELRQRNHYVPPDIKNGVLVWKVILGSPAFSGGLQPGDIVTEIDGKPVTGANDIYRVLGAMNTQRTISMTVSRNGKKLEIFVTPENVD